VCVWEASIHIEMEKPFCAACVSAVTVTAIIICIIVSNEINNKVRRTVRALHLNS
jgi:hypothetical protein